MYVKYWIWNHIYTYCFVIHSQQSDHGYCGTYFVFFVLNLGSSDFYLQEYQSFRIGSDGNLRGVGLFINVDPKSGHLVCQFNFNLHGRFLCIDCFNQDLWIDNISSHSTRVMFNGYTRYSGSMVFFHLYVARLLNDYICCTILLWVYVDSVNLKNITKSFKIIS